MDYTLASYNEQLANDETRDHYGFKRKRSSNDDGGGGDDDYDRENDGDSDASSSASASDSDYVAPSRKRASTQKLNRNARKRARVRQPKWIISARVQSLACDDDGSAMDRARQNLNAIDTHVLERIKKALVLAAHAGTGEAEARNAMRMAHKLMQAHNVSQADVMAKESDEQRAKRAGASVVEVTSRSANGEERGKVKFASWYHALMGAMEEFFHAKSYSTQWKDQSRLTVTFYGLAEGTVAAAQAFEWIHNLIIQWKNEKPNIKTINSKNMYCNGVADELNVLAKRELKEEERAAARAEKERLEAAAREEAAQRAAEIARLDMDKKAKVEDADEPEASANKTHYPEDESGHSVSDYSDGGADFEEEDAIDEAMDLDAELRNAEDKIHVKADPDAVTPMPKQEIDVKPSIKLEPTIKPEPVDDPAPLWADRQQLQLFRNNAETVADAYLAQKKLKLGKARARAAPVARDADAEMAYKRGRKDGKSIEVKRKRIGAAE